MEFFGEGNDPTAGANAGSAPTAPETTPAPTTSPSGVSEGTQPIAPAFRSVGDLAKAWGKPFTMEELAQLYPNSKLFDQSSVDRFVADRLTRERRQAEAIVSNLTAEYNRRLAERGGDPRTAAPGQPDPALVQFKSEMEDLKLDRSLERLYRKFPDFEPAENDILLIAYEQRISPEAAYKVWKYDNHYSKMDKEVLKKQIIDEYVLSKTKDAATTPTPQGAGGSAPVTTNVHDGSLETANRRAKARIEGREVI